MVEVTAAINDAPMGTLTFEDEVFDLGRLQDIETARERKGHRSYRVVARHRETGEVGGHTQVVVSPHRPWLGCRPTPLCPARTGAAGSGCCSRST